MLLAAAAAQVCAFGSTDLLLVSLAGQFHDVSAGAYQTNAGMQLIACILLNYQMLIGILSLRNEVFCAYLAHP